MNFFKDLLNFIIYKFSEKKFLKGYFCENKNIFPYLEKHINREKNFFLLFSFEELDKINNINAHKLVLKTNFFREFFFLTLKLKSLISSTPDLDNSYFKKSKFSKCKYIYIQHTPVSLSMIYDENAFKNFDAIQVINKNQFFEAKEINKKFKTKMKIFKSSYSFLKKKEEIIQNEKIDVLIAPTWNCDFYKISLHTILTQLLRDKGLSFHFRPHYMSFIKNEINEKFLVENNIPLNLEKNLNFFDYNNLITDWSGIFIEFAFLRKKKPYLINTSRKVRNKNYIEFETMPIEISSRNVIAKQFNTDQMNLLINDLCNNKISNTNDKDSISKFFKNNFY